MSFKKIWCESLGERISECDKTSDYACYLRTFYAIIGVVTSSVIIGNAIHHW